MKLLCLLLFSIYFLSLFITARSDSIFEIKGRFNTRNLNITLPENKKILFSQMKVNINSGHFDLSINVRNDGSFSLFNLPNNRVYNVQVKSPQFFIEPFRLETREGKVKCKYFSERVNALIVPIESEFLYEPTTSGFQDIVKIALKNPMMVVMGLGILLMFILPKLTGGFDQEAIKEMTQSPDNEIKYLDSKGKEIRVEGLVPTWKASDYVKKNK